MSDAFPHLQDSFNAAVKSYSDGNVPLGLLVTQYLTAMRHGEADPAEKRNLAAAMFELSFNALDYYTSIDNSYRLEYIDVNAAFSPMFDALCDEASIDFLPGDAGRKMAGISLKLPAVSAKATTENIGSHESVRKYRGQLGAMATLSLHYADIFNKPRPQASVETTREITAARRISLKPGEGVQT